MLSVGYLPEDYSSLVIYGAPGRGQPFLYGSFYIVIIYNKKSELIKYLADN